MVNSNTGKQDPDKPGDDLSVSDGNGVILVTDEEETVEQETEYQLLSMDDSAESNIASSEDEDNGNDANQGLPPITPVEETLVKEVWSAPTPKEIDIEMDSQKIDEVKQAMAKVILPASAIPEWATNMPEDSWKKMIMQRIHGGNTEN